MMQMCRFTEDVDDVMIYELCLTPTPPSCHFARHCLLFALAVSREATVLTLTVEGDRGAGARENRGREGYGRREKKGREAGSL